MGEEIVLAENDAAYNHTNHLDERNRYTSAVIIHVGRPGQDHSSSPPAR